MMERQPATPHLGWPHSGGARLAGVLLACLGLLSAGGCTFIENEIVLLDQRAPASAPASADAPGAAGDTAGY